MRVSSLSFVERKALLQLAVNPILTAFTLKRKRSMDVIWRLVENGYLTPEEDEDEPCAFFLTEKGMEAIQ